MNKQEAIGKLKSKAKPHWLDEEIYGDSCIKSVELCMAIDIVNQIDEPEKTVVPKYVSDWIEWCKRNKVSLLGAMSPIDELGTAICDDKKVESLDASKWATRNQETFAKAWLYGYEIEKEKQYVVVIPDDGRNGFIQLWKNKEGKLLFNFEDKIRYGKVHLLTEQEIKQKDERLWKFAEEVGDD